MNIIKSDLEFKSLQKRGYTDRIVLHHTEGTYYGENPAIGIHEMHLERGWSGIGYHYIVSKDGTIYEGRPLKMMGAHCKNNNKRTVGISAIGNYMIETMPKEQRESIVWLCKYVKERYNIEKIYRHKDLYDTDCPGDNYPFDEIVNSVILDDVVGDRIDYCLEFQRWFNEVTATRTPLVEDGVYGDNTQNALNLMENLIKK